MSLSDVALGYAAPYSIITLVVLAIIRGWLVPYKTVLEYIKAAEYWREAHKEASAQVTELLIVSRTSNAILNSAVGQQPTNGGN